MNIGVFGGTFNPVHKAHIYIADAYASKLGLDKVIFVPTFTPPHKQAQGLVSADHRLNMCRLATQNFPLFEVCDYEILQKGKSYTFKTLEHLHSVYPDSNFFLIMGEDMFLTVQDWRYPNEIYKLATLCAAPRKQGKFAKMQLHDVFLQGKGANTILFNLEPIDISSTMIRDKISQQSDVSGFLPAEVLKYIKQNNLYKKVD